MFAEPKTRSARLRLKKIIPWSRQRAPVPPSPATPVGWTLVTPTPVTPVRVSQLLENVKFTSYGLPYPVEYANVTFKRGEDPPPPPPPKPYTSRPPHSSPTPVAAPDWQLAGESAEVRAAYPPVQKSEATAQGVQIWYASQGTEPPKPMSPALLRDFILEIQKAVAKTGMQGSPSNDTSQANKGQMYRGTYKQVMEALSISGMNTAPCPPEGPVGATRLGAMLVANPRDDEKVEMNTVVLWA